MEQANLIPVKPMYDKIVFDLFDAGEKLTQKGIIVIDDDFTERGLRARKVLVLASGPVAREEGIQPGMTVLVSHLEWTRDFRVPTHTGTSMKAKMTTALPLGDIRYRKVTGAIDEKDRVLGILPKDQDGAARLKQLVKEGKVPDWAKAL